MAIFGIIVGLIGAVVGIVVGLLGGLLGGVAGLLGGAVGLAVPLFPVVLITLGIIWLVRANSKNAAGAGSCSRNTPGPQGPPEFR